jgi:hypothetical protein
VRSRAALSAFRSLSIPITLQPNRARNRDSEPCPQPRSSASGRMRSLGTRITPAATSEASSAVCHSSRVSYPMYAIWLRPITLLVYRRHIRASGGRAFLTCWSPPKDRSISRAGGGEPTAGGSSAGGAEEGANTAAGIGRTAAAQNGKRWTSSRAPAASGAGVRDGTKWGARHPGAPGAAHRASKEDPRARAAALSRRRGESQK